METQGRRQVQARTMMRIVTKMSRNYHLGYPISINLQVNKVFNHGMGSLAFARAVPEHKVLLLNSNLLSKRELERFTRLVSLFTGWSIVQVRLGYPEWYFIKDLKFIYIESIKKRK
jgi:hypothetical protein